MTGTLNPGVDTSDATATAGDIRSGKTAYANGSKLTGTLNPGINTYDATAYDYDIIKGKTAYVDNTKIVGTMQIFVNNKDVTPPNYPYCSVQIINRSNYDYLYVGVRDVDSGWDFQYVNSYTSANMGGGRVREILISASSSNTIKITSPAYIKIPGSGNNQNFIPLASSFSVEVT